MRYILNSAVITSPGDYRYELADEGYARRFMALDGVVSTIGYQETADALALITGRPVAVNRAMVKMEAGDQALVFRLVFPPGTPRLSAMDKGKLTPEYVLQHCEIGLLWRMA